MKTSFLIRAGILLLALALGFLLGRNHTQPKPVTTPSKGATVSFWTCSMHPQIRQPKPGKCPICSMDLIPVRDGLSGLQAPRQLVLSEQAARLADVEITPVIQQVPVMQVRMVGKVEYDESRQAYLTARFPGRIDRLYVDYTGVRVNRGDHLASIYSPELLVAQQELIQARRNYDASMSESVPALKERARDTLQSAREKLRLWDLTAQQIEQVETSGVASDHLEISSPISGVVIHKNAVEGIYLKTGERIYTIADLSRVWVKLDAYESDLQWLHYGQEVEFQTEAVPGETFSGRISFMDPALDPTTRTVKVRVVVDNQDGRLKPDMFVRAVVQSRIATGGRVVDPFYAGKWISPMHPEIVSDQPGDCSVCGMALVPAESLGYATATNDTVAPLVIPASAPLITGNRAVVYVASTNAPGSYEGREIILGPRAGNVYLVKEGLQAGELVVSRGNFKIDSAIQILAKPSMMNPEGGGSHHGHTHPVPTEPADPIQVPAAFQEGLDRVVHVYLTLQEKLSSDQVPSSNDWFAMTKALESVDMTLLKDEAHMEWMKWLGLMNQTLVETPKDMEKSRVALDALSKPLIEAVSRFGPSKGHTLFLFHCPMAFGNRGAKWLQDKETLRNPYFGARMLTCGTLERKLP